MLEPRQISARGCKMRMLDRMAIALPLALTASGAIGQAADALAVAPNRSSAAKPMLIVALGDSTTATARDWAPEIQEVYADCLPKALASHGISAVVINAGLGDTTTRAAILRLDHDVRRYHPDLVIVQFGINDSWIDVDEGQQLPRLSRSEFRKNLKTIVRRLKRDGTLVVLMTPNPMRWSDPFYIKAFMENPGLLDVGKVRGIDRVNVWYTAPTAVRMMMKGGTETTAR
jgi:lysophospholipase L1-like esterase